jgi:uncharacterized membrane protein
MARFRPLHGVVLAVAFVGAVGLANYAFQGGFAKADFRTVSPGRDGNVRIDLAGLTRGRVEFFHFLNPSNQEVRFFVGRDSAGTVQVAFDANEICYKSKRGYRTDGAAQGQAENGQNPVWMVCNKCDRPFKLAEVNAGGGGCKPVPLSHRVEGDQLILAESDILRGWRLFR